MNKKQKKIYDWLVSKPGYIKKSPKQLAEFIPFKSSLIDSRMALKKARFDEKLGFGVINPISNIKHPKLEKRRLNNVNKLAEEKFLYIKPSKKYNQDNVLFIPDLHAPFIKYGVLEWILEEQKRYDCGKVIFAGDIIDGHAWSYHEHDPDGMSVGDELSAAKIQLYKWYEAFPEAICLLGNHDLLISRKAKTAGLSSQFIKDFGSVIEAPSKWKFKLEHIENNVLYHHGSVGDAFKVAKDRRISTCQGHLHSKTFVQWSVSEVDSIFGLQVGWGADRDRYAFDYGKGFATKPVISCGIILDKGRTPIVKLMPL